MIRCISAYITLYHFIPALAEYQNISVLNLAIFPCCTNMLLRR
jgi:hypothetical protein